MSSEHSSVCGGKAKLGAELKEASESMALVVSTELGFLPKSFNSIGQVERE